MTAENLHTEDFDYSYVRSIARIAVYDDLSSAPRIIDVEPAPTDQYIMNIATRTYEQAKLMGGSIPFTIIKEVSENFIHAQFEEIIISILDNGNTIRFADQGPGIENKEKVQLPGYSSAKEPMKKYIRGVGSGLPIVKDYFDGKNGTVSIDDNIMRGAVVTISLNNASEQQQYDFRGQNVPNQHQTGFQPSFTGSYNTYDQVKHIGNNHRVPLFVPQVADLSERGKLCLSILLSEGTLGVTEIAKLAGMPASSTYNELKKLEQAGLIEKTAGQKRSLTEIGFSTITSLQ